MSLRTALLALAAIAIASPALAQAPADGVWKGTGLQVGRGGVQSTWTIRMTIRQGGKSEIEYPSLDCRGVLTQAANGVQGFEFNERITEGACIDHGRIVARQRAGKVFWFWYLPGGEDADASAVLYRDDLFAGLDPEELSSPSLY
jgi:hypothetical protein